MVALAALQTYRPSLGELRPLTADAAGFTVILLLIDAFATQRHRTLKRFHEDDEDGSDDDEVINLTKDQDDGGLNGPTTAGTTKPTSLLTIVASYPTAQYDPIAASVSVPPPSAPLSDGAAVNPPFVHLLTPPSPASRGSPPTPTTPTSGPCSDYREPKPPYSPTMIVPPQRRPPPQLKTTSHIHYCCARACSFPCLVPPLFLGHVEGRETWALVVLAHFWALVMCVVVLWWVGNAPGREVRAI
ncbi:hypothetical protein PG990_014357 [Apiospora arundinis]